MGRLPLNPKSRIRPVFTEPVVDVRRAETVIYQLEDTGHPVPRLRPTVREVEYQDHQGYLYRVEAFSRLTGEKLGVCEVVADQDSAAEHAARTRDFMSPPFRATVGALEADLVDRFHNVNPEGAIQE